MPNFSADDFTTIKERLEQIKKEKDKEIATPTDPNSASNTSGGNPQPGYVDDGCYLHEYAAKNPVSKETDPGFISSDNSQYTKEQAQEHLSEASIGYNQYYASHNLDVKD